MNITYKLAELLDLLVFNSPKPPYWMEIKTKNPACTYYFGHFNSPLAAKLMKQGYIKDLIEEEAIVESVKLKQCEPHQLTIFDPEKKREN
jgi:hypothetical protein